MDRFYLLLIIQRKTRLLVIFFLSILMQLNSEDQISWVFTDYPPANYKTENGELTGFFYEIVTEAFENRLGADLNISIFPWKRCQMMIEQGLADIIITTATNDRLEYAIKTSKAVLITRLNIYTYSDHEDIETINTLKETDEIEENNLSVISYLGNGWAKNTLESKNITVDYATDNEGMYLMLANRRADILIEESKTADSTIKNLGLESKIIKTEGIAEETRFYILFGKNSPHIEIMDQINSILIEMHNDGTIAAILSKYEM